MATERRELHPVVNFFRVSPQLHIPDLLLLAGTLAVSKVNRKLGMILAPNTLAFVLIFSGKALHNLKEYHRVKDRLSTHGWDERYIDPMTTTPCDQNAAKFASYDTGFKAQLDKYYQERGLRRFRPFC